MVDCFTSLDSLSEASLQKFSLEVVFDLFELVDEVFAVQALPRNGHKFYQRLIVIRSVKVGSFRPDPWGQYGLFPDRRILLQYQINNMSANYDWVKLNTPQDYKFFACIVAEKLRNNNFKSAWRQAFLKSLIEELKPSCSYKAYERIEKLLHEVASQKHQEEKEEQERLKKQSNVKQKNLKSLKAEKAKANYNLDEESFSDQEDEDF